MTFTVGPGAGRSFAERRAVLFMRCWLLLTGSRIESVRGGLAIVFDDQQFEAQHLQYGFKRCGPQLFRLPMAQNFSSQAGGATR
jgi:hypothetical protein